MIDEAHERSLNIDFLIGYLAGLLPRRRDLNVIISSATSVSEFAQSLGITRCVSPERVMRAIDDIAG